MTDILVTGPFHPFTLPTQFKAVFNGYIYCGTVDAVDPSVSQVQVFLVNEDNSKTPVAQPLRTNAGGFLVYDGQPAKFVTEVNHSLLVQDAQQVQVWYAPEMANIDPQALLEILQSGDGAGYIGYGGSTVEAELDKLIASNMFIKASEYATPDTPTISQHVELQAGWDAAAAQGKVFVVDGVYWVTPTAKVYSDTLSRPVGVQVPNNSKAWWMHGASIKAIPSALPLAYIINFYLAENFELWNPVVYGDVDTHTGTEDESYHCFNIVNCRDGYVHRPKAFNAWGDGLYIGTEFSGLTNKQLENVTVFEPYAEHCGRNCISVTSGKNVKVVRPTAKDAFRVFPKAGIDIEPEGVGACLPVLDGVHIVGPVRASNCDVAATTQLFSAVQGVIDATVGDVYADNCKNPVQCVNLTSNGGAVSYGNVFANGSSVSPVIIKWAQTNVDLTIGDVHATNACTGAATGERYKSIVSVDVDIEIMPAGQIGNFRIGDVYINNTGVNNVLVPFYYKDNTAAANRVLGRAKIGRIFGSAVNSYFHADGVVSKDFEFTQAYTANFFQVPRRPILYSEVKINASGFDFEISMGADYDTPLKITKNDLTTAPIKLYPRAGGTFYPLSNGGPGYLQTVVPGASMSLALASTGPHFFQTDITGTWTAP